MVKVSTPARKESVWTKGQPKKGQLEPLRPLPQVPKTRKSMARDLARPARKPGLRLSRNGKKYWETRENRSDKLQEIILNGKKVMKSV